MKREKAREGAIEGWTAGGSEGERGWRLLRREGGA